MKNTIRPVAVLGSTGSVGTQSLDVIRRLGIPVRALAARSSVAAVEAQAREFLPRLAVMYDEAAARDLRVRLADTGIRVLGGMEGLCEAACSADIALTALSGMVGLKPTLAAIDAGCDIALANKETLVCAGKLVMQRAAERGVKILPVDSEHSAIFQCLESRGPFRRILLTASGGSFFGMTREQTYSMGPKDALRHPTWNMGAKITVDSGTLMNKGLEFIEAMRLYNALPGQIEVIVHWESIVHSLVEFPDGAVIGQLGVPDMRLPIQYALTWPERTESPVAPLDLAALGTLHFTRPDTDAFPCLRLAMEAAAAGGTACPVLNGADEAAVGLFLQEKLTFGQIADAVAFALDAVPVAPVNCVDDVFTADALAREAVARYLATL